jgi:hypothetical protein
VSLKIIWVAAIRAPSSGTHGSPRSSRPWITVEAAPAVTASPPGIRRRGMGRLEISASVRNIARIGMFSPPRM